MTGRKWLDPARLDVGIAQLTARMRLFFAISALGIMLIAAIWTGFIMIA